MVLYRRPLLLQRPRQRQLLLQLPQLLLLATLDRAKMVLENGSRKELFDLLMLEYQIKVESVYSFSEINLFVRADQHLRANFARL